MLFVVNKAKEEYSMKNFKKIDSVDADPNSGYIELW